MEIIEGKTAIITGAASGIGKGCAQALARAGACIVAADINLAGAENVASEIRAAGGSAIAARCDVGLEGEFEKLRDVALGEYGSVDIVMNNAAIIISGHVEDLPVSEWERVLNVNLMSVVRSHSVFVPMFLEKGAGHIVNTASFAGLYTYSFDRLPYAASKAAVFQISEGLALYLRPKGIGVTVLCPGPVKTNIMQSTKVWTDGVRVQGPGPEFGLKTPDQVGELVLDAIRRNVFFLPTDPQVTTRLVTRAQDFNANLQHWIDHPYLVDIPPMNKSR